MNFTCIKCGKEHKDTFQFRVRSYSPINCNTPFSVIEIACPQFECLHINHSVVVQNTVENLTNLSEIFDKALHGRFQYHYSLTEQEIATVAIFTDAKEKNYLSLSAFQSFLTNARAVTSAGSNLPHLFSDLIRLDQDDVILKRKYSISFPELAEHHEEFKQIVANYPKLSNSGGQFLTFWTDAVNKKVSLRF